MPVKDRLLPFAVSFVLTCLFFINICDWIFSCGCHSLWAGADAMCNVHVPASRHCPVCSRGIAGYIAIMAAISAPQIAASMWIPRSRVTRTAVCVLLIPGAMAAIGLVLGSYDGYW
jgi:hypothetical protein